MIGIIGAMDVEIAGLVELADISDCVTVSGINYHVGKLSGKDAVIAKCSPGKVNAAICAQTMILKYNADILINTGVAGSLSVKLGVCDVAVADFTVQHDMDTTPLGDPPGFISGLEIVKIPADQRICELLAQCASECDDTNVQIGTIASGDQFLNSGSVKERIKKLFGAIAGEMEGGSIGHTAYANGVPYGVLRVISDGANDSADIDFPTFCKIAAEKSIKICKRFTEIY